MSQAFGPSPAQDQPHRYLLLPGISLLCPAGQKPEKKQQE